MSVRPSERTPRTAGPRPGWPGRAIGARPPRPAEGGPRLASSERRRPGARLRAVRHERV